MSTAVAANFSRESRILDKACTTLFSFVEEWQTDGPQNIEGFTALFKAQLLALASACDSFYQSLTALPGTIRRHPVSEKLSHSLSHVRENLTSRAESASERQTQSTEWFHVQTDEIAQTIKRLRADWQRFHSQPSVQSFLDGRLLLGSRQVLQWPRKLAHTLLGLLTVWLYVFSGLSHAQFAILATTFSAACLALEFSRLRSPRINAWAIRLFRITMRERERNGICSASYYIVAMYTVFLLFSAPVAVITLLYLALGDTIASVVGLRFGKHPFIGKSTIEGTLAGFITCFLSSFAIWHFNPGMSLGPTAAFAAVGGLIGSLSETLFPKIDDNLIIPMLSAPVLALLLTVL